MVIPNIIDESVPIGKDDSENVENERFGEPVVPDYEMCIRDSSVSINYSSKNYCSDEYLLHESWAIDYLNHGEYISCLLYTSRCV